MGRRKGRFVEIDVDDWLDVSTRSLSLRARAVWLDVRALMIVGGTAGVLVTPAGSPYSLDMLSRLVGISVPELEDTIGELRDAGLCSVRADGAIESPDLVRADEIRRKRAAGGKFGGNPRLSRTAGRISFPDEKEPGKDKLQRISFEDKLQRITGKDNHTPETSGAGETYDSDDGRDDTSDSLILSSSSTQREDKTGREDSRKPAGRKRESAPEWAIEFAGQLAEIVETNASITIDGSRRRSWASDIRKLHERDGVERERISAVLGWYRGTFGEPYVAIAESGRSFRAKFSKLERRMSSGSGTIPKGATNSYGF